MAINCKSSVVATSGFMRDFFQSNGSISLYDRTKRKLLQDMEHIFFESNLYIYTESPLTEDDVWQGLLTEGRGETDFHIGDDFSKMNGALKPKKASKKLLPSTYFFESIILDTRSKKYFHLDLDTYLTKGLMLRTPIDSDFEVFDKKQDMEAKLAHVRNPSRYIIIRDPHLLMNLDDIHNISEAAAFWISSLIEFPEGLEHVLLLGKVMSDQGHKVSEEQCVQFSELLGNRLEQQIPGFRATVTIAIMPYRQKGRLESWHGRHIYTSYAHHIIDDSVAVFENGRVKISNTLTITHQLFSKAGYQSKMSDRLIETCAFVEKYAPNHGSGFANWMRGWMR